MSVYDIQGIKIDGGLSEDAKQALLNSFAHNAWADQNGDSYNNALREALYADNVDRITAVFTPGTHAVYPTDNIESLRNFLTVTAYYSDGTHEQVQEYELSGDISSTGTKKITVTYEFANTATFNVTVVNNTTGLLYDWDFTKGLTDLRQGKTASLRHNSESTDAIVDTQGVHFTAYGQMVELMSYSADKTMSTFYANKTIQVDVASFAPNPSDVNNIHTRLIMFRRETGEYDSGMIYYGRTIGNMGWNVYAGDGWGDISNWGSLTDRAIISGHTIGLYINNSYLAKLFIDGISKGTQNKAFLSALGGLALASSDELSKGATFYPALVTGVRIYDGEVA